MKKEGKVRLMLIATFSLIILSSYFVFSQPSTGEFTIGNENPTFGEFAVQDGSDVFTNWDNTAPRDTHDITPNFAFVFNDPNLDTLTTTICVSSNPGGACDLDTAVLTPSASGAQQTYQYAGVPLTLTQATDCNAATCTKTFYVAFSVDDGNGGLFQNEYPFVLTNKVPNTPTGLSSTLTHNPNPILSWTATDTDQSGAVDSWPADSLTHHIRVGTSFGDGTYENNDAANNAGETVDNAIPWGATSVTTTDATTTTYIQIWSTDSLGINSAIYTVNLDLVDNFPTLTEVLLSSDVLDGSLDESCTAGIQNCFLTPVAGSYSEVNAAVRFMDADGDCSDVNHDVVVVLCRLNELAPEVCDETTNAHYTYDLSFDQVDPLNNCVFNIAIPQDNPAGVEFFRAPNTYKMYVKAASQAGMSSIFPTAQLWDYGTLAFIDYPSLVELGDGSIQLGQWNPGTTSYQMINHGNALLSLGWDATDAGLGGPTTCSPSTSTCWDLTSDPDLQVDDDSNQADDTGNLAVANIPETPATTTFEPAGGLAVCNLFDCSAPSESTLNTNFHILPPTGLSPGTYQTDITITLS